MSNKEQNKNPGRPIQQPLPQQGDQDNQKNKKGNDQQAARQGQDTDKQQQGVAKNNEQTRHTNPNAAKHERDEQQK
jgi:hypothetical protein